MGPLIWIGVAMLTYEFGKSRPGGSIIFPEKKVSRKLDANLDTFQKNEVFNALAHQNDPQKLHAMAMGLQQSPIAGNAIETKSQTIAAGHPYQMPDFDYS